MKLTELIDYPPDYMPESFVWWDRITYEQVDLLEMTLSQAKCESDMQAFLAAQPAFLIQHLGGGHGRWVIPQKRLGSEYVPDFVVGERHSFGFEWQIVEIESPKAKMFNKNGDPSAALNHAISQILNWRAWLKRNQDYASRPKILNGLGLTDIDSNARALIIIGRRADTDPLTRELRRQMCTDLNADIHSYDWLTSRAKGRLEALTRADLRE